MSSVRATGGHWPASNRTCCTRVMTGTWEKKRLCHEDLKEGHAWWMQKPQGNFRFCRWIGGIVRHDTGVQCQFLDGQLSGPDFQDVLLFESGRVHSEFLKGEEHTKEKPRWYMIHSCLQCAFPFPVSPLLPHCRSWQASGAPAEGVRDVEGAFDSRFAMIWLHLPSDQRENPSIFQSISQGRASFNSYMIIVSQAWRLPNSRCFSGFPTFGFSSYLASFTYDLGGVGGKVSGVLRVELDSYSAL